MMFHHLGLKFTRSSRKCFVKSNDVVGFPRRQLQQRHPDQTVTYHTSYRLGFASGIDKVAENKIAEWLHQGGNKEIKKGGKIKAGDGGHKGTAYALGLKDDYIHSKILADNNIKPDSIVRRIELDKAWKEFQHEIQQSYIHSGMKSLDEFIIAHVRNDDGKWKERFRQLDQMAKKCNDAILSDSMRFNGRSPVQHARRFNNIEVRIREAIELLKEEEEKS